MKRAVCTMTIEEAEGEKRLNGAGLGGKIFPGIYWTTLAQTPERRISSRIRQFTAFTVDP